MGKSIAVFGPGAIASANVVAGAGPEAPILPGPVTWGAPMECQVMPVDDDWAAIAYFALQGRALVLAELRVLPRALALEMATVRYAESERVREQREMQIMPTVKEALPYWSGAARGVYTPVPAGGIDRALLRRIPLGPMVTGVRESLRWRRNEPVARSLMAQMGLLPLLADEVGVERHPRGRRPVANADLLRAAREYDRAVKSGSRRPIKVVASRLKISEANTRKRVFLARKAGHLTGTQKTFLGGTLSDDAKRALAAMARGGQHATTKRRRRRTR